MTIEQLQQRVAAGEKAGEPLQAPVKAWTPSGPWWVTEAGRLANDPVSEEMVWLGR